MGAFFGSGVSQSYSNSVDFDDGSWCLDFSMTAVDSKDNSAPVTSTSQRTCVNVDAMPCDLTAATYFTGALNSTSPSMSYSAGSSFTMNSWCDINELSYEWTYAYMDMPEADADDTLDYKTDLAAK
jgi:hypothetical protein